MFISEVRKLHNTYIFPLGISSVDCNVYIHSSWLTDSHRQQNNMVEREETIHLRGAYSESWSSGSSRVRFLAFELMLRNVTFVFVEQRAENRL